jgi:hypothetical protein
LLKLAGAGLLLWSVPGGLLREASAAPTKTNVVLRWNDALLEAVRATKMAPPITARALAITHTAMYDAWTPYTKRAKPTRPGPRRPQGECTLANKSEAISHAAYAALVDLFPSQKVSFDGLMKDLGYAPPIPPSTARPRALSATAPRGRCWTPGATTARTRPTGTPIPPTTGR